MTGLVHRHLRAGYITPFLVLVACIVSAVLGFFIRAENMHTLVVMMLGGGASASFLTLAHRANEKLESILPATVFQLEAARFLAFVIAYVAVLFPLAAYSLVVYLLSTTELQSILSAVTMWTVHYFTNAALNAPVMCATSRKSRALKGICAMSVTLASIMGIIMYTVWIDSIAHTLILLGGVFLLFLSSFFLCVYLQKRSMRQGGA